MCGIVNIKTKFYLSIDQSIDLSIINLSLSPPTIYLSVRLPIHVSIVSVCPQSLKHLIQEREERTFNGNRGPPPLPPLHPDHGCAV